MPTLSRFFIHSVLAYLGIGFTIGGLILSAKAGAMEARVWSWLPVHIVFLMNGWLVQLTLGAAYWILPRIHAGERGRRGWAWAGFVTLQTGLVFTAISGAGVWLPSLSQLFAPAFCLQVFGVGLFAIHAWPRIRPTFVRANSASTVQSS
jgi:hypothetical protein